MKKFIALLLIGMLMVMVLPVSASSLGNPSNAPDSQTQTAVNAVEISDGSEGAADVKTSHRLIVELASAPLSVWASESGEAVTESGRLDFNAPAAKEYMNALAAEQSAFVQAMRTAMPNASVATYVNELGANVDLSYQVSFNGLAIDTGSLDKNAARKQLAALPGVKAVYYDYAHQPDLYASLPLINAAAAWNDPAIGGMGSAGEGIKVASMDGGAHHEAPMFDGTGYSYPADFPPNGLGLTANNNGKIIASRAYFRSWDPPSPGDENPWPGVAGTSHGTHTASTAAGNEVVASYLGVTETISGVAPRAWVMSYRVFYNSVTNDGSFYTAEGIAALEDIMMDGADVLNNSWGGGPGSIGGEFDPLDTALINVSNAGTFVTMSAGNAGPNNGTTDHPSDEYINVAASTTSGTLASGRLNVVEPAPVPGALQSMSFGSAGFGAPLPIGSTITYTFITALSVDAGNVTGCSAWTGTPFTGGAAVISRGSCDFSQKVYYAEQAGAEFAVIYNNAGDSILNMSPGDFAELVTIPSVFVGQTNGDDMVAWYTTNGAASVLELNTVAFQAGNTPDFIASFSSRGPGVGNVLKPDITAPGVNILAQGYAPGTSGEDRHLGWGQSSGTSMAAPHVTGAAALLRQIHPDWSNAYIKSALMSTSKYIGIWNGDNSHAQPLDMGAGRLDLTNAADPGVILDGPSVGFGQLITGTMETRHVMLTSVAPASETYNLSTLLIGGTYPTPTLSSSLPGFAVSPSAVTLDAGASAMITVTFDASLGSIGDNQGFIVLDGATYDAHLPVWARVAPLSGADVLIIDNDGSSSLSFPDYLDYYTDTLDNLGMTYDILDTDADAGSALNFLPEAAVLSSYKAVLYYTGDYFYDDGTFTVPTPLTAQDMDRLTEYANGGGIVFAMGQDLASVLNSTDSNSASFFYASVLGGEYLQDSVSAFDLPSIPVSARTDAPAALQGVNVDLSGPSANMVTLTGAQEAPTPVATDVYADAWFAYNVVSQVLDYEVEVHTTNPVTITASHIHTGTLGVPGGVLYPLFTGPSTLITDTFSFEGSVTIANNHVDALLAGDTYINIHSTANPAGEVRAQVITAVNGDGAGNQFYVDEIAHDPNLEPDPLGNAYPYMPLLQYTGPYNVGQGTVAMAHRDQPTLENPGLANVGRSIYTTFGLEGVNNGLGSTSREELLGAFFNWAMDEPSASVADVTPANASNLSMFEATVTSNITGTVGTSYRWDFGDGNGYEGPYASNMASHTYATCGTYTVRVEAVDSWGNTAIGSLETVVDKCESHSVYLPVVFK